MGGVTSTVARICRTFREMGFDSSARYNHFPTSSNFDESAPGIEKPCSSTENRKIKGLLAGGRPPGRGRRTDDYDRER